MLKVPINARLKVLSSLDTTLSLDITTGRHHLVSASTLVTFLSDSNSARQRLKLMASLCSRLFFSNSLRQKDFQQNNRSIRLPCPGLRLKLLSLLDRGISSFLTARYAICGMRAYSLGILTVSCLCGWRFQLLKLSGIGALISFR